MPRSASRARDHEKKNVASHDCRNSNDTPFTAILPASFIDGR
jgi:hypothetical protein